MWWVIMWFLLVVASGGYLVVRAWGLWGQAKELGSELAAAQRGIDEVQGKLELLGERIDSAQKLAVFADPATARKERGQAKAAGRQERERRRAISRPAWAKHLD